MGGQECESSETAKTRVLNEEVRLIQGVCRKMRGTCILGIQYQSRIHNVHTHAITVA